MIGQRLGVHPSHLVVAAGTIGIVFGLVAAPAGAASRIWAASGAYAEIVIADCRECGDDIGMMVACRGPGAPAEVTVHWAAGEDGQEGAVLPIIFNIDGQTFTRRAVTRYYGQIGYTPEFELEPDDPLIPALQAGSRASIAFAGGATEISLRGSRSAFEIFKAHCGWNEVAAGQSPVVPAAAPPEDDGAAWFTNRFTNAETGRTGVSLTFGIPETDAVAFHATCEGGNQGPFIPTMMLVDFGDRPNGVPVEVLVRGGGFERSYSGTVSIQSSEYAGAQVAIDIDDPVWAGMRSGQPFAFGVRGLDPVTIPPGAGSAAIGGFLAECRTIFAG